MGSVSKKTGNIPHYNVSVVNHRITNCTCPAREFRSHSPCKHMKSINQLLGHSL